MSFAFAGGEGMDIARPRANKANKQIFVITQTLIPLLTGYYKHCTWANFLEYKITTNRKHEFYS